MKKYLVVVIGFLLMFVSPIYSQVNGKIISPSFSPVSQFVISSIESNFVVLTNRSSFKLEIVYITPDGINAVSAGLDNDVLPGKSIKVLYTGNKGVKCYRAIAYKAIDMELKTIPNESQDSYTQRYNKNKSRGCELMKLQAQMGKEVCQAINGSNSCFSDAASVLEQNNWCDNSSGQSSNVEQPSTFQQQPTSKQQSNQNNLSTINDAIATTGNTIWDIIQSGKARKEGTGKAIVNSFAKDLYERKKNIKYYDDVQCDKCNGSGTLIYNDNPNSIIYGQSHPCEECNGIGRINKLKSDYALTFGNTHSQSSMDFGLYLLKAISNKVPLCKLNPSGYKGSIEMKSKASVGGHYDDLILIVTTTFNFLDRKGKFDADGYIYNSIDDKRVFPLNTIKSFEYIPSKTESIEGTLFQYSSHIILNSTTGETFEFTTDNDPSTVSDRLNELLNAAKKTSNGTSNESKSETLTNVILTENSSTEETISFINEKLKCCQTSKSEGMNCDNQVRTMFDADEMVSGNNWKLKLIGKTLYLSDNMTMNLESSEPPNRCDQYLYLSANSDWHDQKVHKASVKFYFKDVETVKEVVKAFVHLKSLVNRN